MKTNWSNIFTHYSLIIGIILIFIIPPMQAPDETVHFLNAYAFSEGEWFPSYEREGYMGRVFPKALIEYISQWSHGGSEKATFEMVFADGMGAIDREDTQFYAYWASETNLAGYFITGFGMLLVKLVFGIVGINMTGYSLLTAGRIANLFFYTFVVGSAIKICPLFKQTIFLIALMPMSFYLAVSLSYDTLLISSSLILFAIFVKLKTEKIQVTRKWLALMCGLSFVLFNVKLVYAPLLTVLTFIPIKQFGGKRKFILSGIIVAMAGLLPLTINKVVLNFLLENFNNPYAEAEYLQRTFVMANPFRFLGIIINTLKTLGPSYFREFIGHLGTFTIPLPSILLLTYGAVIVITGLNECSNGNVINLKQKIVLSLMLFTIIYMSFGGIYTTWTAIQQGPGGNLVLGVQGRYFIPFAIFILLLVSHENKYSINSKLLGPIVYYSTTITLILICILVLLKFWVL